MTVVDTPPTDDILKQAADRAREALPKPIARLVTDELQRGILAATHKLHYPEYGELAGAVLALPAPAPAVDREGLTNDTVTEHAIEMSGGGMHVRYQDPDIERIYPLAQWIPDHQRHGWKVWRRRIRVVGDWVEVPPDGGEHRG